MDSSKEKQLRASTQHNALSTSLQNADAHDVKVSTIVLLLAKLGIRRQAKLEDADYLLLADDLSGKDLRDIEAGLGALAQRPREAGETAFPDLGTMLQFIKAAANARITREHEAAAKEAREAKDRHVREHPEEYVTVSKEAI